LIIRARRVVDPGPPLRSDAFESIRATGKPFRDLITPGSNQWRDDLMKRFKMIVWAAVILVLFAAYLTALTKLRLAGIQSDPQAIALRYAIASKPVSGPGARLPAQPQPPWLARGLYPNGGQGSTLPRVARGDERP
jgi:hypothetical protein